MPENKGSKETVTIPKADYDALIKLSKKASWRCQPLYAGTIIDTTVLLDCERQRRNNWEA